MVFSVYTLPRLSLDVLNVKNIFSLISRIKLHLKNPYFQYVNYKTLLLKKLGYMKIAIFNELLRQALRFFPKLEVCENCHFQWIILASALLLPKIERM